MMKKELFKIIGFFTVTSSVGIMSSCDPEIIELEQQIVDIGGAGHFYAINNTANDTVEVSGGIYIGVSYPILNAKNGDEIILNFVPNDKYSKYTFNVTYILSDSTKIEGKENDYVHSFTLEGLEEGIHNVSMSAGSTEHTITSFGEVVIKIYE